MRIYIPEVKKAKGEALEYQFNMDLRDCYDDFPQGGNLSLKLRASYSSDQIVIRGNLEAVNGCECSRCLDSFQKNIKAEFSETFTLSHEVDSGDDLNNLSFEAANSLTIKGDYLYLDEYIRQQIILAQDYSPICMPDCKGLCPKCGTNLNRSSCRCNIDHRKVDPRLLKLKEFSSGS